MLDPALTPAAILSVVTTVTSLFLTQGLITNHTEKLVTGLAAAFIPWIFFLGHAIFHSRVKSAKISMGQTP